MENIKQYNTSSTFTKKDNESVELASDYGENLIKEPLSIPPPVMVDPKEFENLKNRVEELERYKKGSKGYIIFGAIWIMLHSIIDILKVVL